MADLNISDDANATLGALLRYKNVLLTGAPGTGKTRLMSQVAKAFEGQGNGSPYLPDADIALPSNGLGQIEQAREAVNSNKKVFRIVMSGASKQRDLLTGIVPVVGEQVDRAKFQLEIGALVEAANFASIPGNSSLLIVDELNRGPAVEVFGPSIAAIESNKRLADDGSPTLDTQFFRITGQDGQPLEIALPARLYLLAAMNQADVSVSSLDIAFLRRWHPIRLSPSYESLEQWLNQLPFELSARGKEYIDNVLSAWKNLNKAISLIKGPEFEIGQGLILATAEIRKEADLALFADSALRMFIQHIQEVFFGDTALIAHLFGANKPGSPVVYAEETLAGRSFSTIHLPKALSEQQVLAALKAMGDS